MRLKSIISFLCVLSAPAALFALPVSSAPVEVVNGVSASYYDGSLWIGSGQGIVRVGRNGRTIHYTENEIGVSRVLSLASDESGNMWILGSGGAVRRYSFLDGFTPVEGLSEGVELLACNPGSGIVFASSKDTLYSWKTEENPPVPERVCSLPSPVREFSFAPDGAVWLTLENALLRLDKSGVSTIVPAQEESSNVSKSITFKIETNTRRIPWVWVFLALLLGLALAYPLSLLFKHTAAAEPKPVASAPSKPVVSSPRKPAPSVPAKPVTPGPTGSPATEPERLPEQVPEEARDVAPDAFVAEVERIIRDNIATPKFGVDEIAEITGVSRIHVNRKLKAAGAPSPSLMLKKARMETAAKLVAEGKVPMQDIALRCGFSSASYFATSFKEYFGVAPTDYKA